MDKTGFPNPETIRNELEEGAGICRPGRVLRKHYANRLKNGSSILPDESEHLYLKALMAN